MEFYYNIYGLRTKCNVYMELLTQSTPHEKIDIEIVVNYETIPLSDKIKISKIKDNYEIVLCNHARYVVYPFQSKIECTAVTFEAFFSTLFNIPFSVYFMLRGEMLLHCCTMTHNNKLICFMGEKGVGKSTLTKLLNGDVLKQYSDDTLRVACGGKAFRAHNLIKYTPETVAVTKNNNITNNRNLSGKVYAYILEQCVDIAISRTFVIKRSNIFYPRLSDISTKLQPAVILDNIVGINYFDCDLLKLALNYVKTNRFYCSELSIPNNISDLVQSYDEIINIIDDITEKSKIQELL